MFAQRLAAVRPDRGAAADGSIPGVEEERRRQMFDCWCVAVTSGLARRGMEQDGDRRLISIFPNSTLLPPSWEARGYLSARLD